MADNKRNSAAGKVVTPKTGSGAPAAPPLPDIHEAIAKAVGARIKVTTSSPESKTYDSTLYTADPVTNLVVLNTRISTANNSTDLATQPGDYRVLPISRMQNFQILSMASGDADVADALPMVAQVDVKRLEKRCDDRVAALKELERHRGRGVTKEAQAIYDSFKRINMPIRWHNQEMIVFEAVIIAPPYRAEDCKGAKDKQEVLIRVRKALEGERKKLLEKERKTPAVPNGPRKGG